MRIGRGKIAGAAALLLWTVVAVGVAAAGNDRLVLALVAVAVGAAVLLGVHLAVQVRRVRADQRRTDQRVREVATRRDVDRAVEQLQVDVADIAARNADDARRQVFGHIEQMGERLSRTVDKSRKKTFADLSDATGATRAKVAQVLEELASTTEAGERRLEALQEVRVDIEWLEDVLLGITHHLSPGGDAVAPSATDEPGAARDLHVGRRQVQALQASVEELAELLASPSRRLASSPGAALGTDSSRRLNALLATFPTPSYLEIGLEKGRTFEAVDCDHRVGVEPVPRFDTSDLPAGATIFVGTSDDFFRFAGDEVGFDVVFVDGLHTYQQTYRDLVHSLGHLCEGGVVVVDDVVPSDEVSAIPDLGRSLDERRKRGMPGAPWHGDVFRIVPLLRDAHPRLEFRTIVGSGNEQLLLWNPDDADVEMVGADELARYGDLGFDDVFADGIPAYFNAQDEQQAIREIRSWRTLPDPGP